MNHNSDLCEPDTTTDDIFANSSAETIIEKIDFSLILKTEYELHHNDVGNTYSSDSDHKSHTKSNCILKNNKDEVATGSTNISVLANEVMSEACNIRKKLYCPFCVQDFSCENTLKDHIKHCHKFELESAFSSRESGNLVFHSCLFCHAKVYFKDLLLRHVMHVHQNDIIRIFQNSSSNKYIQCQFCSHKVLRKHAKLLMIHVERKHISEFESYLHYHLVNDHRYIDSPSYSPAICGTSYSPSLNDLLSQISTDDDLLSTDICRDVAPRTSILRDVNSSVCSAEKHICFSSKNFIHRSQTSARRGLQFENTGIIQKVVGKNNLLGETKNPEEKLLKINKKKSKWKSVLFLKRCNNNNASEHEICTTNCNMSEHVDARVNETVKKKMICSTPIHTECSVKDSSAFSFQFSPCKNGTICKQITFKSAGSDDTSSFEQMDIDNSENRPEVSVVKQFKCALCLQSFIDNCDLLSHIKKFHKGPRYMLQPQYKCGECEATFYKNSFLLRHCKFHHTPLCMRSKIGKWKLH